LKKKVPSCAHFAGHFGPPTSPGLSTAVVVRVLPCTEKDVPYSLTEQAEEVPWVLPSSNVVCTSSEWGPGACRAFGTTVAER